MEPSRVSPQIMEQVRKLRNLDDRLIQAVSLPPAPQAPWCPSAYVLPIDGRALVAKADRYVTDSVGPVPPDSPTLGPAKVLSDLFRQIEAGWPVLRVRLGSALGELAALMPEGSDSRSRAS